MLVVKNDDDKVQEDHLIVCYDSSFKEIWRDTLRTGRTITPGYLTFNDGQWLSYGYTNSKEKGVVFYKLSYDKNGKLLEQIFSERIYEADVVGEISGADDNIYRFYTDNGWRIDKVGYSD
jgi:hypothetical protein